jgi:phosphoribosylanthranilate isomerase
MSAGLVHVAGIRDAAEADMLIECGVTHLGFPLILDHHAEDLSVEAAAKIVREFGGRATFFLITYLNQSADIVRLCNELGVAMVQLHGGIALEEMKRLRATQPDFRIVKSLVVTGDNTGTLLDEVGRFSPFVDAFITDTFDPLTGARGATGKTHDWAVSRKLVETSRLPVILAGGLNPRNVGEAIRAVRPAGVDVHTGIENPDGQKSRDLTLHFVAEARAALAEIGRR